jgi:exonuclease SbcC
MRFDSLRLRDMGCFRGYHEFDFAALPGPLVAICGGNGAGKSTMLGLLLGAITRESPTNGSLVSLARSRESYVEVSVQNGQRYNVRQLVDAISKKGETLIQDADGRPLVESGKVRDADAFMASHFPPADVLLASVFSAQESKGFIGMSAGERKGVILRIKGIGRLEALAERAREHARETRAALETLEARVADERARSGEPAALDAQAARCRVEAEQADAALATARASLESARAAERAAAETQAARERRDAVVGQVATARAVVDELAVLATPEQAEEAYAEALAVSGAADERRESTRLALEAARREAFASEQAGRDAAAARTRRADFEMQIAARRAELADYERRIAANRGLLADAEAIRAAVDRASVLVKELEGLERADAARNERLTSLRSAREAAHRAYSTAQARTAASEARGRRIRSSLVFAQRQEIADAIAALPAQRERHEAAREAARLALDEVQTAKHLRLTSAEERNEALRKPLVEIGDADEICEFASPVLEQAIGRLTDVAALARATVREDDAAIARATEAPAKLEAAELREREVSDAFQHEAGALQRLERLAAKADELAAAEREAAEADVEAAAAFNETAGHLAERVDLDGQTEALMEQPPAIAGAAGLKAELEALAPKADLWEHLTRAEDKIADYQPRAGAARAEIARLETERAGIIIPEVPKAPDVTPLDRAAADADAEARAAGTALAIAEERLAAARAAVPRLETARVELGRLEARLADTPDPGPAPAVPDVAGAEGRVSAADEESRRAHAALAVAEAALEASRAAQERIDELEAERARLDVDAADWTKLSQDLGQSGLIAAEVDSAGPELSAMANELLHTCFSPRWTISIETTRLSADGKRQIEGCEVRVLDTVEGRDADAKTYSGGERVILNEAVSLALTMLACRHSGLTGVSLVRDESGSALAPENARAYVAMLRLAVERVGASRCLFVSHDPAVQELADARIDMDAERSAA